MTCHRCGHPRHYHISETHCLSTTISGPSSTDGKPRPADGGYDHVGRIETRCDCIGFLA